MSHQQLAQTGPTLWAPNEPSLPVLTRRHRNALDHLGRAFTDDQPLAVLIDEGIYDASYLVDRFLAGIESDVAAVRITEPCTDAIACMRGVINAIGFESKDLSLTDLENVFTMFLSFQKTHRHRTIICMEVIPEYGPCLLATALRLVELESEGKFGLTVILSGRPNLNQLLDDPLLDAMCDQAKQRIGHAPFTLAETREYMRWRIESTGTADIAHTFEFDAISLIHELSGGVADTVSNLCTKCLELLDEGSPAPATTELVKKADELLCPTSIIEVSEAEAGFLEANGVSQQTGRLIARMDGEVVQELPLNRGHILIGRHKLCDIRIASPTVSRHHALIVNSSNVVKIVDLGSTNGTFVDGREIREYVLQDSGEISVGDCRIEYVASDDRQGWVFDIERTDTFEPRNADHDSEKSRPSCDGNGKAAPAQGAAPDSCNIKGNINSRGDRIYHVPGSPSYGVTEVDESKGERWFRTEAEARSAGWRAPHR